jgi:hypothetical protein
MKRLHRISAKGNRALKEFLDAHGIDHKYEESIVGKTIFLLIPELNIKEKRQGKRH